MAAAVGDPLAIIVFALTGFQPRCCAFTEPVMRADVSQMVGDNSATILHLRRSKPFLYPMFCLPK